MVFSTNFRWRISPLMAEFADGTTIRQPMLGASPAFRAMLEQVSRLAPLDRPALIIGERGTGKELVAARLHYLSPRWEQPLVKLNCAALTESLLESELFGHEAGAFTGATKRHVGRFERADGGSLFLDELGTLPARMQEKILRVIEYGEFERVGGSETLKVDVRIVGRHQRGPAGAGARRAASAPTCSTGWPSTWSRAAAARAARGHPRAGAALRGRLHGRAEAAVLPRLQRAAQDALLAWPWPGNVRELKNAVERSIYRAPDPAEPLERDVHFDPFAGSAHRRRSRLQPDQGTSRTARSLQRPW
jgi:psp operon transcriptional activator